MPWWGWLILICVVLIVGAWLTIALFVARRIDRDSKNFDDRWDKMHRGRP